MQIESFRRNIDNVVKEVDKRLTLDMASIEILDNYDRAKAHIMFLGSPYLLENLFATKDENGATPSAKASAPQKTASVLYAKAEDYIQRQTLKKRESSYTVLENITTLAKRVRGPPKGLPAASIEVPASLASLAKPVVKKYLG